MSQAVAIAAGKRDAVFALLIIGFGGLLGFAATDVAPRPAVILLLVCLTALLVLTLTGLPEWRLPRFLVAATILSMGLAVAEWSAISNVFNTARFVAPLALSLVVWSSGISRLRPADIRRGRLPAVALVLLIGLSAAVSIDPRTTVTKSLAVGVVALGVMAALRWTRVGGSLHPPVAVALTILVGSNCFAYALGVGGYSGNRYKGWTINPNALGIICALAVPVLAALLPRSAGQRRALVVVALGITAVVLLLTGSRSALLGAILGLVTIMRSAQVARRIVFPILVFGLGLIAPLVFRAASDNLLRPVDRLGVSGRQEVWPVAWNEMWKHPLLGVGFATTEARFLRGEFGTFEVFQGAQFHNSYLEAGVEMGVPGGVLLAGVAAFALSHLVRRVSLQQAWAAGLAVTAATAGVFETGLLTPGSILFFPFWLSIGVLAGESHLLHAEPNRQRVLPASIALGVGQVA